MAPGNNWAFWCGDSVAALQGPKVLRVLEKLYSSFSFVPTLLAYASFRALEIVYVKQAG